MALSNDFIDTVALATRRPGPLVIPWPIPGNPAGFISFANFGEWRDFVLNLSLRSTIPEIVRAKFERAQKVHVLAWIDFDLIKAGELVALTAIELALIDRYGPRAREKYGNMALAHLLRYMPEHDGLTRRKGADDPPLRRHGLTGKTQQTLANVRNEALDDAETDPSLQGNAHRLHVAQLSRGKAGHQDRPIMSGDR